MAVSKRRACKPLMPARNALACVAWSSPSAVTMLKALIGNGFIGPASQSSSTLANGVPWLIGSGVTVKPSERSVVRHWSSVRPQVGGARCPRTDVTTRSTHWLAAKRQDCDASPTRSSRRPPGASAARMRANTSSCVAMST